MPSLSDVNFGKIALRNGLIQPDGLWQGLRDVAVAYEQGREKVLAEALVELSLMVKNQADRVRRAEALTQHIRAEKMLGRLAVQQGLVAYDVVHRHLESLKQAGFRQGGLGQMLVEDGVISRNQLEGLFDRQTLAMAEQREHVETMFSTYLQGLGDVFNGDEAAKLASLFEEGGESSSGSFSAAPAPAPEPAPPSPAAATSAPKEARVGLEAVSETGRPINPEDCPIYGYELLGELGKGSMGVVYKARHFSTGRIVALKILPLRLAQDTAYLERFKREAIAAMRMNHDNIVRAYDFGGSEEYYYLALEFVEGTPLDVCIAQQGKIPEMEALKITGQVAAALDHANEFGVVHRDIKPENIILTSGGTAKLSDFGIVKLLDMEDSSLTAPGTTVGTPYYISPEQARGDDLDIRSDLYSLGITLFHLVTGELPFSGKTQGMVLLKHLTEPLPDPLVFNDRLSASTIQIITKMAAKKPEERFQRPREVTEAIEQIVSS